MRSTHLHHIPRSWSKGPWLCLCVPLGSPSFFLGLSVSFFSWTSTAVLPLTSAFFFTVDLLDNGKPHPPPLPSSSDSAVFLPVRGGQWGTEDQNTWIHLKYTCRSHMQNYVKCSSSQRLSKLEPCKEVFFFPGHISHNVGKTWFT